MKHARKLAGILLAMVMALALALPAFAEETTYSITIKNEAAGHTYEAYQIFTGTPSPDEEGHIILSDINWGSGVSETGKTDLGTAKTKAESLTVAAEAEAFAKQVANYLTDPTSSTNQQTTNTANEKCYVIDNLPAGYYLIKDKNDTLSGQDDAYTAYILQVVNNQEVDPKSVKPQVDKQVHDETGDAENGASDGWGESADHAINESFQFKLIATLPADENYDAYEKYKVIFTDTMSDGVTFESIASVKVNNGELLSSNQYNCTATAGQAGGSWTLTIADLTKIPGVTLTNGATIEVIYNAHLNEKAQVNKGSGNTSNQNKVGLEYSNNPNGEGMGKTPEDIVWVFTYEVDNTKRDGTTQKPLANAKFKLYDSTGDNEIGLIYDDELNAYRPVKGEEQATEMTSGDDGKFNIKGLDAGTYILKETTPPAGYNRCEDKTIVISATHIEDNMGTSATTTLDQSSTTDVTVDNFAGSTLPSTGGIGTTIFYVVGSILVLAAVVLLITKKRMSEDK